MARTTVSISDSNARRLRDMKEYKESINHAIGQLIDLADLVDARLPPMQELK